MMGDPKIYYDARNSKGHDDIPRKMPRPTPVAALDVDHLKKLYIEAKQQESYYSKNSNHHISTNSSGGYNNHVTKICNQLVANEAADEAKESENPEDDESVMCVKRPRRMRKRLAMLIMMGITCFVTGIAIALLIKDVCNSSDHPSVNKETVLDELTTQATNKQRQWGMASDTLNSVLKELFISVKTTKKYHHPRLIILLETWVSLVKSQTWFFTDDPDPDMSNRSSGHLVLTNCSSSHSRTALACKMATEFDHFLKSHKSWWCHFDDDNYVHVTRLAELLSKHDSSRPIYLGKPSTAKPLEIFDIKAPQNVSHFWFATGGAGFCVSRTLALKMAPYAGQGKFVETGDQFWFPDDVTLGYIIEHLLGENLTVVPEFHSHLEPMKSIPLEDIDDQISFSYISYNGVANVLDLPGPLPMDADPTRFYSLHCRLYGAPYCPQGH